MPVDRSAKPHQKDSEQRDTSSDGGIWAYIRGVAELGVALRVRKFARLVRHDIASVADSWRVGFLKLVYVGVCQHLSGVTMTKIDHLGVVQEPTIIGLDLTKHVARGDLVA